MSEKLEGPKKENLYKKGKMGFVKNGVIL